MITVLRIWFAMHVPKDAIFSTEASSPKTDGAKTNSGDEEEVEPSTWVATLAQRKHLLQLV